MVPNAEQEEAMRDLLEAFDLEQDDERLEQLEVFIEAMCIYNQRSEVYGQAWRQYGALSNLLSMARKVDRLMAVWWNRATEPVMHKEPLDDASDLLNYCVFFMRNARSGNMTGTTPERPHG